MLTKTIDLQKTPLSLQELLALVKQDTLIVLKEGDQEIARVTPSVEAPPDEVEARVRRFRESARRVGKAVEAAGLTEEEMMATLEETRQRLHEARLKAFREAARDIGEEIAKSGLSEDELMRLLEETRQEAFEERYTKK